MSSAKEETLTVDELRERLYQTFKNKGVLDTIKTQLRNQFIQELKPPPLTGQHHVSKQLSFKCESLLLAACNSIVADHLSTSGYEYTLSVFYPESGLSKEKVFSKEDLLQFLKISPQSALYKSLSSSKDNNDEGFLMSFLSQLMHHYTRGLCRDADTQTTSAASHGESLVDKMKTIDKEYENVYYAGDKWFSLQSKVAAYRKEIDTQMQAEMNTKMRHFKDVEIAKVRMEEKETFHKEFDKLKKELERTYELKAKSLIDREKNAIDRLQKQQEIEEKNVYMQRQSVLKEIETLRNRESELRKRTEDFEKTCHIQDEKVKTAEELLRRRELAVKTMEDTHEQRLKNELSRYQLELKEEFIRRTEKLTEDENRIIVETARIQNESAVINTKVEEHRRACSELRRLQSELDTAQQQISLLTQQKELQRERLEQMSDYPSLKREKAEIQGQLQLLQKQLEEILGENRTLRADLGKPSKEHLALQMELRRLQSARRLDEEESENQKQVLQAQLQREMEQCAQLKARLRECEEKAQWMTNQVEDIKLQLRHTQQALENEVLRNPKPSLVDRSVLELSADKLVPPDIYVDRALLRARVSHEDHCHVGGTLRGHKSPWNDSPDSDMEAVAKAKARIEELQAEAETLEEAYRTYRQRAVDSAISQVLPPSPHAARHSHQMDSPQRKQASHYSPCKTKMPHKPPPPQMTKVSKSAFCETRNTGAPAHPRVTFLDDHDQPNIPVFTEQNLHLLTESLFLKHESSQDECSTPPRRLASTPQSSPKKELPRDTEKVQSSGNAAADPVEKVATSDDFSELSSPRSPQLKSTVREPPSSPTIKQLFSSSDSSPQPEKLNLEDLTGIMSEPGHIPELLLDTAVPLSAEAPERPAAPRPQDLPGDPSDLQGQTATSDATAVNKDEEHEEEHWERERRERQEQRQREQEAARERELEELKRLEQEMVLKEVEQAVQEKEAETGIKKGGDEEQSEEAREDVVEAKSENPLEKYMRMVLEAREKQLPQTLEKEEAGLTSPESKSFFEEKDNSVAAYSHKEKDDDFW